MRLTRFTDLGLRACMRMAAEPERVFSTADLAAEFDISRHHLTKAISALASAGIVETRRGTGGGAQLAKSAQHLTIGRIVAILEQGTALVECFEAGGGECQITSHCRLKGMLSSARAQFLAELDRFTLADCASPAPESV